MTTVVVEKPGGRPGTLRAVPAVHCRHAFAAEVRRLCVSEATRPAAIAVELSPAAVSAAAGWLRELDAATGPEENLPCLLGLTRASVTANVTELLPLAPGDSIIEAIRCAIEYGVPVYGIDADNVVVRRRRGANVEDPCAASANIRAYVERNGAYASLLYDRESDGPREAAMARGLGAMLRRYDSVLVTGGLGHWQRLQTLLADPGVDEPMPEQALARPAGCAFTRVLVHPLEAIRFLDVFPRVTTEYQRWRRRIDSPLPDPAAVFGRVLARAYRRYFRAAPDALALDRRNEDLAARRQWEQLLGNLCVLRREVAPSLSTALEAAEATMTPAFREALLEALLVFPWATPRQFPDLPVFGEPASEDPDEASSPTRLWRPSGSRIRDPLRVRLHWSHRSAGSKRSVPGRKHRKASQGMTTREMGILRSWPPGDRVASALCYRAAGLAEGDGVDCVSVPFSGSWTGRLDVRGTVRGFVRGERIVRLHEQRRSSGGDPGERLGWEPTVFLFAGERESDLSYEVMFPALIERVNAASEGDRRLLDRYHPRAHRMVSSVGYGCGDAARIDPRLLDRLRVTRLAGSVLFMPPHLVTALDEARWLERMGPGAVPTLATHSIGGVADMLATDHGIVVDLADWRNTLVRMALPYARRHVVVVSDAGFQPAAAALADARRLRVELATVPASALPRPLLDRVSRLVMARPWRDDPTSYPARIEAALGERADAMDGLVPACWREVGTFTEPRL